MGDRLRELGYDLTGAAPPADEHLDAYRRLARKRRRRLRRRREADEARVDSWPVRDMSPGEAMQRQRVRALEQRVATLEATAGSLTRQRDAARTELARLRRSRSWRWTCPLRAWRRRR